MVPILDEHTAVTELNQWAWCFEHQVPLQIEPSCSVGMCWDQLVEQIKALESDLNFTVRQRDLAEERLEKCREGPTGDPRKGPTPRVEKG